MVHLVIQSVSILLQSIAVYISFSMIRMTGKRNVWVFMGIGLLLMDLRRILILVNVIKGVDVSHFADEMIALCISAAIVVGTYLIRPLFASMVETNERIRDSESRMEFQRNYFETIVNQSVDALFMLDWMSYRVTFCNERAVRLFGAGNSQGIIGKTWSEFLRSPFQSAQLRELFLSLDQQDHFDASIPFCTLQGGEFWGDVLVKRILVGGENFIQVRITEVTERKKAEEALRLKSVELEQLNATLSERVREEVERNRQQEEVLLIQSRQAALGEMIANIAHQWKTPLNALGLLIQSLPDTMRFSSVTQEYVRDFNDRGMALIQHMSQTMDDFRDFFKPNREKVRFSIRECVQKTFVIVFNGLLNENIAFQVELQDDLDALGYPNEYSQALLNLINNSREALLERRVADPKIEVRLFRDGDRSCLSVSDNAGGIDPAHFEKLYRPYFTTKRHGTGLGLSMTRTIVEKNFGGTIAARNTERGAEFSIRLPIAVREG
jgi:PAS domain S-box-containing protein